MGIGLGGQEVGKFFEGQKKFDIVVRLNDNYREDLREIALIPVTIAGNKTIPLSEVAKIRFKDNYSSFSREQAKRRIAVLINPRGKDTEAFVNEAKQKIEKELKLPDGIFLEWGGNFKNLKEQIDYYLAHAPLREEFRWHGFEHVREFETYTQRAEEMLEVIKNG